MTTVAEVPTLADAARLAAENLAAIHGGSGVIEIAQPVRPPPPPLGEESERLLAVIRRGVERAIECGDAKAAEVGAAIERLLFLSASPPRRPLPPQGTPKSFEYRFGDASHPSFAQHFYDPLNNLGWVELSNVLLKGIQIPGQAPPVLDTNGQLVVIDTPAVDAGDVDPKLLRFLGTFQGFLLPRATSDDDGVVAIIEGFRAVLRVNLRLTAEDLDRVTNCVLEEAARQGHHLTRGPSSFAVPRGERRRLTGNTIDARPGARAEHEDSTEDEELEDDGPPILAPKRW